MPQISLYSLWALPGLSTKQLLLAAIDPLIGKWPVVVKGLDSIDRQEEMEV